MRLQQGFAASEMGFRGRFAQQQSWAAHVRFGSESDIEAPSPDVRFTPKSGHALSKGARAGAALEIFLRFKTLACPTFVKRSIVFQCLFSRLSHRFSVPLPYPPKADIVQHDRHVRFVPLADINLFQPLSK